MITNLLGGGAVAALLLVALISLHHTSRTKRENELDPQVILRRCRQELQLVRIELEAFPASREMYDIFAQINQAELTIDQVARRIVKTERS